MGYLTKKELQGHKDRLDKEEDIRMELEPHSRIHHAKVRDYSTTTKLGRNESCLCKSGLKYKHCCWKYLN